MKPAPFDYFAPTTIDEALGYLAEYGYDAKVLAGGQSLVPMMNFRLAQPSILVDINNIKDLSYIRGDEEGGLSIATGQVRSRGTFGGSIAHADPAAELGAVSVALDGSFLLRSRRGERWVPGHEFFLGLFTSVLEPDELLIEAKFPALPERTGYALIEIARRPHDFALVGVAAVLNLDKDNRCQRANLVLYSVGDGPMVAHQATEMLEGKELTPELMRAAADAAAKDDIDPGSDIHASAEYRRHLAGVLSFRALEKAYHRAQKIM